MNLPLRGIIPPVATPLIDNDTLDAKGLENLLGYLLAAGVHGLFILGTTGEATSLNYRLRKEVIKRTCEFVDGRVPVLAGITDTSADGSLMLAGYAAEVGVDCLVVAPPYYLPISQEEMRTYLEYLIPELPLPLLMYNMPGCTKMHMSVETIDRARELGALGVKDSSGDKAYLHDLIEKFKDYPDFSVLVGTELYLPDTIMLGGHGAVPGGANVFPGLFVDYYQALMDRDTEKIAGLGEKVKLINRTLYQVGTNPSRFIPGIKCALSVLNICSDYVAWPLRRYGAEERKMIGVYLEELKEIIG